MLTAHKNTLASCEDSPILLDSKQIGWHCVLLDKNHQPVGGGLHASRNTARRIAFAESLEAYLVNEVLRRNYKADFKLDTHPTSCGFAVGFDDALTKQRAICEAIERWAWSKWIDSKFAMEQLVEPSSPTALTQKLLSEFSECQFYFKEIQVDLGDSNIRTYFFGVVLGFTQDGIFPGSRVSNTSNLSEIWQHSALEAWRHKVIAKNIDHSNKTIFPFNRIHYFARNKRQALEQVEMANTQKWETARLMFLKNMKIEKGESSFLWRALFSDYISWELGDESRFVY